MQQDNSNNFLWFVTGATIGAGVALLVAPQGGERTRLLVRRGAAVKRLRILAVRLTRRALISTRRAARLPKIRRTCLSADDASPKRK